jgi:cell division septation protein DedD
MSDETASQPPIKITWLIGTLAAFAIFVVIAAYSSRMTWDYTDYDQQDAKGRYDTLDKLRHDETALIDPVEHDKDGKPTGRVTAEWIDQAKGIVRIPIEEAMVKEIDTLKAKSPKAGNEIPGAAAAPASTNAAPAKPAAPASTNAAPAKPAAPAAKTASPATATPPPAKPNP